MCNCEKKLSSVTFCILHKESKPETSCPCSSIPILHPPPRLLAITLWALKMRNTYSLPSAFGVGSHSSMSQTHLCITALLSTVISKRASPMHLYARFITFIEINCNKVSKGFLRWAVYLGWLMANNMRNTKTTVLTSHQVSSLADWNAGVAEIKHLC